MLSTRLTIRLSAASLALTLTGASASAGLGSFFVLNNAGGPTNGLYSGQVGVDGSNTHLSSLPGGSWFDLAPGFDSSFVFAMDNNTLARLSTADGSPMGSVIPDRNFISIATDTSTSTVYAVVPGVPGTPQFGELITVNPVTGQTTTVGQLGGGTAGLSFVGLGYDPMTDHLFLTATSGELFSISANTGAATLVGSTGLSQPNDIDYNPEDGNMYITDAWTNQLFIVDRTDASVLPSTLYTDLSLSTGLAFAIPAPGSAALLSLAGLAAMRRRR